MGGSSTRALGPGWDIWRRAESDRGDGTQNCILEHALSITYHGRRASGVTLPFLGDTGERGLTFVEPLLGTRSSSLSQRACFSDDETEGQSESHPHDTHTKGSWRPKAKGWKKVDCLEEAEPKQAGIGREGLGLTLCARDAGG